MKNATLVGMLAIVGALAVGAWACSDDDDNDGDNNGTGGEAGTGDGTGGNGDPEFADCDECMASACPAEKAALETGDAAALTQCWNECGSDGGKPCADACIADHPEGWAARNAYDDCLTGQCSDLCI